MDQVFAVRHMYEKYLVNRKDVFWTFMYLERVYNNLIGMAWQMLRVYGVGGKLLKAVNNFM